MRRTLPLSTLVAVNLVISLLGLIAFLLMLGFGWVGLQELVASQRPAQAAVIELRPDPPTGDLCPGDTFTYTFRAAPLVAPTVVRLAITLYSFERNETIIEQRLGNERVRIWLSEKAKSTKESYTIPTRDRRGQRITPGRYELRVALVAEATVPSAFELPFTVVDGCTPGSGSR